METMNLKRSSIFLLATKDQKRRECWGCRRQKKAMYRDVSTGGYLCRECMPDVYWAGVVLNQTYGIRDPRPGECQKGDELF
jgi:hypothetical protein